MHYITRKTGCAAALIAIVAMNTGCSAIGYYVGGAIDGGPKYELDSISVRTEVAPTDSGYMSLAKGRLTSLARDATQEKGALVEVRTPEGNIKEDCFTVDIVLAVKGDSADSGGEQLLPGRYVTVTLNDNRMTQLKGRISGLSKKHIRLQSNGADRIYPFENVNEISMGGRMVLKGAELTSPRSAGRFILVPGVILGYASPPHFIPLREVDWIGVTHPVAGWGPARSTGVVIGGALDILAIVAVIETADSFHNFGSIGGR